MWWLVGLGACVWIGPELHQDDVRAAYGLDLPDQEVPICGGDVMLTLANPVPDGLPVSWSLGGLDGDGSLMVREQGDGWKAVFPVGADDVASVCGAPPCELPLQVSLEPVGATLQATATLTVAGPTGVPGVALADGASLTGDLRVLAHPLLTTMDDGVVATACPTDGGPCIERPFVDGALETQALDVCPAAEDAAWTLVFSAPWERCPDVVLVSDPVVARFLGDDCDADGRALADDCDDFDPALPLQGWLDADLDGYGSTEHFACPGDPTLVMDHTDCDDADGTAHPGGMDTTCDGVDQDCVGDDGSGGVLTFGPDGDMDGYGPADVAYVQVGCAHAPSSDGGDCDDDLAMVNPAATEDYGDLMDDDCDGRVGYRSFSEDPDAVQVIVAGADPGVGQGDVLLAVGSPDLELATAGPGVATLVAAGDVSGDGFPDLLYRSADLHQVLIRRGIPWDGPSAPIVDAQTFTANLPSDTIERMALGDVDGDGQNDLVTLSDLDRVRVYLGPVPGSGHWQPSHTFDVPGVDRLLVADLRGACGDDVLVWGAAAASRIRWTPNAVVEPVALEGATDIHVTGSSQLLVLYEGRVDFWDNVEGPVTILEAVGGTRLALSDGLDLGIAGLDGAFVLPQVGNAGQPEWGASIVLSTAVAVDLALADLDQDGTLDAAVGHKALPSAVIYRGVLSTIPFATDVMAATDPTHVLAVPGSPPRALFVSSRSAELPSIEVDLVAGTERPVPVASDAAPVLLGASDRPTFAPQCAP